MSTAPVPGSPDGALLSSTATERFGLYLADRNLRAARLLSVLAAILVPSGVVLDWFTNRSHVGELLMVRLASAVAALACLALSYAPQARRHTFWLGLLPVLAAAIGIEVMIERLEGYSSPYYAGLTHCLFALGVIFYWRVSQILLACSLILLVWLLPTLLGSGPLEPGPFANNFFALSVAGAIAVASNENRFRAVRREFGAREELEAALARLRELDHAKSQFFANVSHELRTPLTLILAPLSELLERTASDAEARELVLVAQRNAGRLLLHIDELLDLSRLDAGRLRLNLSEVDLGELLSAQLANSHAAATAKGQRLTLDVTPGVPAILGDAHRIEIILTNLVSNALKYSMEHTSISLHLRNEPAHVVAEVKDDGPGIPAADVPRIFERFYQVSSDERRRQQGAGIGLALARDLAELHGGELTVASELGRGATFTLRLRKSRDHFNPEHVERRQALGAAGDATTRRATDPQGGGTALIAAAPVVNPVVLPGGARPRILVVEDNVDLLRVVKGVFASAYEVHEAIDGQDGLEKVRALRPDVVVSDVMMPRMSGTDLCGAIKGDPELRRIPVILLTARVGSDATMEAYSHGADDFVAKPFHPRVLLARVTAQLRIREMSLRLLAQEKTSAIGTLAAGVAHEVRNPINAITGACQVILMGDTGDERKKELIKVALDAAWRIDGIVGALDATARPAEVDQARPYDLRQGLDSTLVLLHSRLAGITVERRYETTRAALVRASAVNQVLVNLLDNAARAGSRHIQVSLVEEGDRLRVAVADDGAGVPQEIASRLFDPFFTTREPGQGTGLGLHLSRQIVEEHGGRLEHRPRDGGGTEFYFDVPAA